MVKKLQRTANSRESGIGDEQVHECSKSKFEWAWELNR